MKILFTLLFYLIFTLISQAKDALPILLKSGESLTNSFDRDYYIDESSQILSVAISQDSRYIISGSWDNTIKIWDSQSGKLLKELIGGSFGSWLVKDFEKGKFFRGDDGRFLLKKLDGTRELSSAYPYDNSKETKLTISSDKKSLSIADNHSAILPITIENIGGKNYFLKVIGGGKYLAVKPIYIDKIDKGKKKIFNIEVFAKLPRYNPKPTVSDLNLTIINDKKEIASLSIPVKISSPQVAIDRAEISEDGKNLNIIIKNIGDINIKRAFVKIEKPFENNTTQEIRELDANKTVAISYILPKDTKIDKESKLKLKLFVKNREEELINPPDTKIAPAYEWQIGDGIEIILPKVAWYLYILLMIAIVILGIAIYIFSRYGNSLVVQLSKDPHSLLTMTPELLKEAKERLSKIDRFDTILNTLDISRDRFDETLAFFTMDAEDKAKLFAKRIDAKLENFGRFYRINLSDFELYSVKSFLLYISEESFNITISNAIAENEKIFIIANIDEQNEIAQKAHDKSNYIIAPTNKELNKFLLSYNPKEILVDIFSSCLLSKDISPYQTNGGVENESNFFGRVEELRKIIGSNHNYLIVGARQLGKSSLLKALKRRYDMNPRVNAYLFTMSNEDILSEMKRVFSLDRDSNLEDIISHISMQSKKSIFLIDEADEFIEEDAKNGYKITKAFRKLSQDGKANFIIAGFWTLYYYATSDYQAPLKNFGELIRLGKLEDKACRDLMIEPMKRIGINYENPQIIDRVISRCGNRANLISITCNEVLKIIQNNTITQKDIEYVIEHGTLEDYLKGWEKISGDEKRDTLDRAIIFLTIDRDRFRLSDVVEWLAENGLEDFDENIIYESLERLVVGYFLKKEKDNIKRAYYYSYRVPLFKEKLLYEDIEVHLKREIRRLKELFEIS